MSPGSLYKGTSVRQQLLAQLDDLCHLCWCNTEKYSTQHVFGTGAIKQRMLEASVPNLIVWQLVQNIYQTPSNPNPKMLYQVERHESHFFCFALQLAGLRAFIYFIVMTNSSKVNLDSGMHGAAFFCFTAGRGGHKKNVVGWGSTGSKILRHSSYLSQPPQPAVVYFFLAGVLFSIEDAKCWPNLASFDQFWLFCREFTEFLVYFL